MALTLSFSRTLRLRFMLLVMFSSVFTLLIDRLAFPGWISAAILAFSIPFLVQKVRSEKVFSNIIFGILQGNIMLLACFAAYYIFA